MAGPDVAESNKPPLPPPVLTHLGRRKVWKSGGAGSNMVGMIYPLPGCDWVNWSVKNLGWAIPPPPARPGPARLLWTTYLNGNTVSNLLFVKEGFFSI